MIKTYTEYRKNSQNSVIRKQPNRKWAKDFNRYFTNEDIWIANKHMKDVQNHQSLGTCKLKSQHDSTANLLKLLKLERLTIPNVGKGVEELELSCTVGDI